MLVEDDLTPRLEERVTSVSGIGLDDREDEMQVGVLQLLELQTSRTNAAAVALRAMRTIQILGIGKRQLQLTDTGYTCKQLRMRYSSLTHGLTKLLLRRLLSYYLPEKQF